MHASEPHPNHQLAPQYPREAFCLSIDPRGCARILHERQSAGFVVGSRLRMYVRMSVIKRSRCLIRKIRQPRFEHRTRYDDIGDTSRVTDSSDRAFDALFVGIQYLLQNDVEFVGGGLHILHFERDMTKPG